MANHIKKPPFPRVEFGYIGEPLLYSSIAKPLINNDRYLRLWNLNQQWFSYSQPSYNTSGSYPASGGDDDGTEGDKVDGNYYIILHSSPREDTTSPHDETHLHGVLMPWRYAAALTVGDDWDYPASIKWQEDGGAQNTLWQRYGSFKSEAVDISTHRLEWGDAIEIGGQRGGFTFTPESSGGYTFGTLTTEGLRTAALGVWPGPDPWPSDDNAIYRYNKFGPGRPIRGYTTTGGLENIGNLIHQIGYDEDDHDSILNASRVILFQWGHPCGVFQNANSYSNIAPSGTTYKITPPILSDTYDSGTMSSTCACMIQTTGASGGDAAYIRYTSSGTSDTAISTITSNYGTPTLVTFDTLTVDTSGDEITVEIKAPANEFGEIILHTASLWGHVWQ